MGEGLAHTLSALNVRPGESVGHTFTEVGTYAGERTLDLAVLIEVRESSRHEVRIAARTGPPSAG
jgi:hypothetical protein